MAVRLNPEKYLRYLYNPKILDSDRTKEILSVNPTVIPFRQEAREVLVYAFNYNGELLHETNLETVEHSFPYKDKEGFSWINIDGLRKAEVEKVCAHFQIHPLFVEDILSTQQRPKMDEVENRLLCLLNMLYYNEVKQTVEQEQISILLGPTFLISFQEDASRDVFNPLRERLKFASSKIRQRSIDYLCYTMLDLIVDNYYLVMEKLGDRIETLEEEVIHIGNKRTLAKINQLRKEIMVLKRNILPVRDLIAAILKSESNLLDDRNTKYFKDVYDHIVQAIDLTENYRDMILSLQDLYINNVNLKSNDVMKVMAIVTCLLAPATVIGGIFGMNFDTVPYLHNQYGFWIAVAVMLLIPLWMILMFKKRGWF